MKYFFPFRCIGLTARWGADNLGTVRRVLRFLGLDADAEITATEANPTVRVRSQQLDDAVHALSIGAGPATRLLKAAIKALTPRRARHKALRTVQRRLLAGAPDPEDEQLMAELRCRYRAEVMALSDYLGRDLVQLWG